jgi:hypothetical protein
MEAKLRKLNPKVLKPPDEVIRVTKEKKRIQMVKNPILRFFYTFFGEGF